MNFNIEANYRDTNSASPLALSNNLVIFATYAGLTVVLFAVFLIHDGNFLFPNDDAYIYLHSAQAFWAGHDQAYAGTPPLIGVTSGVFFAGLLLLETIIHSPEMALYVWCMICAIAYLTGIHAIARSAGCSASATTAVVIGSLVIGGSTYQLLNGLDTGLTMAAVAWDLALLATLRRNALALLSGLMLFVRPELILFSVASMSILFLEDTSSRRKLANAALFLLPVLPFALWFWIEIGSPIPSTISAKEYFFAEANFPVSDKIRLFLFPLSWSLLLTSPLWACIRFIRPRWFLATVSIVTFLFLSAYLYKLPGMLAAATGRYMFTLAPILSLAIAHGISAPLPEQRKTTRIYIALAVIPSVVAL